MNPCRDSSPAPPPGCPLTSGPQDSVSLSVSSDPAPLSQNPYQVSVIMPSPCPRDGPDLECSICFSCFNNVFRCPKMLQCGHTFCLECLARINVKSYDPAAVVCPLCRTSTLLPPLGPPRLQTDAHILSCLPTPMQRVYSVRFVRDKGKLQVKRSSRVQNSVVNRSLDVGVPSPSVRAEHGGVGEALFRLTGQPACRAFLLTAVVMMIVMLTGIIVFIFTHDHT